MSILNPKNTANGAFQVSNIGANLVGPKGRIPEENLRRRYDLGNSVSELNVSMTPFLTFISKTRNKSTADPQFKQRFHRDNAVLKRKLGISSDTAVVTADGLSNTVIRDATDTASDRSFSIPFANLSGGGAPNWLLPKQTFAWKQLYYNNGDSTAAETRENMKVQINVARVDVINTAESRLDCTLLSSTAELLTIPQGTNLMITGTAWEEGSRSPDTWIDEIGSDWGQVQIFKTAADMTNSALATEYAGYEDEWARLWNMKIKEHNLDLERSMVFGTKNTVNGVRYTDGIASYVTRHPNAFGWTVKKYGASAFHYDDFLGMSEAMFDEGVGNTKQKLVLCGSSVLTYLNKIKNGFLDASVADSWMKADIEFDNRTSAFGHNLTRLTSVHGELVFVKHPGFRDDFKNLAVIVDMNNVNYRPLVGNGKNRDTHILTNVQDNDVDIRKDMIITEAGLQIDFPETHGYLYFEDQGEDADESQVATNLTNTQKQAAYIDNYGDIAGTGTFEDANQG